MTQEHPITPPPELVHKWMYVNGQQIAPLYMVQLLATQAARWGADQQLKLDIEQVNQAWQKGADQEMEACCQALFDRYDIPSCISPKFAEEMRDWLRAVRRPKPLTLKEQALQALDCLCVNHAKATAHENTIRHALEQLND